jgi:hypothetical protein
MVLKIGEEGVEIREEKALFDRVKGWSREAEGARVFSPLYISNVGSWLKRIVGLSLDFQ